MKILQVNNIVSHHQLPFSKELVSLVGEENFLFAALGRPDSERLNNGWKKDYNEEWIIHPNDSIESHIRFDKFWHEADVVICGERLISKMQERVDDNKICFYMSERWWKPPVGMFRLFHPLYLKMFLEFKQLSKSKYFHYLPIGPFAARDMALMTSMPSRVWAWGYFTAFPIIIPSMSESRGSDVTRILWVGRMIKCKRVDLLIKALAKIKNEGKKFELTLVGNGSEREYLEKLAKKLLGASFYEFKEFIPSDEVPFLMAQYDIYVLPSSAYEGWGAVVNEAMSAGCAVIASDKTGAGASLIEHGVNGLLFKSGSEDSLYDCLSQLVNNKKLINDFSVKSRLIIRENWTPAIAAERFVQLSLSLINNEPSANFKGPLEAV
ncbi:glycosyltransferase family 4 protein [Psychrobacter sp. UBA2769]|uniref:glycosyltransferase family 4 protein n=1 Tax=Psychrobacter sp. UBA2769 TaxID=1947348 RepID=UPI0025ECA9A0|nr:glycosyltransferase family 4 protein [Psychrobacter sp. UBA2769]